MSKKESDGVKFTEKLLLKFRKKIIVSRFLTIIVVLLLICAFIGLNKWVQSLELPEIDVTANKIYTLSDSSKEAIKEVDQDTKIYVFGIEEDSTIVNLIKQYCNTNNKITYEMLTKDSNLAKVQEFDLEDGYSIIVIEAGGSKKIINAQTDFTTYDQVTYKQIDITEQTLTNSILSLVTKNKPKVYFTTGHGELDLDTVLMSFTKYLENEAIEYKKIDISSVGKVSDDCNTLVIMSPSADFLESEAQAVIDYINKGGNLFITKDVLKQNIDLPNFQKILDLYGVSVENGYIVENDSNYTMANYPYIFKPQISSSNSITSEIYSDGYMLLAYAGKVNILPEENLKNLNVVSENLLETTDSAYFITDFSSDSTQAAKTAQNGKFTIAAQLTKTISGSVDTTDENAEQEDSNLVQSKMIILADGACLSDAIVSQVSNQYPLSYLGNNMDFGTNVLANLGNKEGGIKIRKDMAGTSYAYTATQKQTYIVMAIIFAIPVLIIIIGIIVGRQRKKRK